MKFYEILSTLQEFRATSNHLPRSKFYEQLQSFFRKGNYEKRLLLLK